MPADADNDHAFARQMLRAGMTVAQVERALYDRGVPADRIRPIVDEVMAQNGIDAEREAETSLSPVVRILGGFAVLAIAVGGIYAFFQFAPEDLRAGRGAVNGSIRGAILGACVGAGIGTLNLIRKQLFR